MPKDNAQRFVSDDGGQTYNNCHCTCTQPSTGSMTNVLARAVWSNFEIGDLDFWRGEAYTKFFDFLDKKGGFYYEVRISLSPSAVDRRADTSAPQRWGDAPVHSIGAALFAKKDQIHFFNDIGA